MGELSAAETAGERVYIIGHTPPGGGDAFHDGSNYFDQIVNRYTDTIAAMFWGHTHQDQWEVSYSDYTNQNFNTASAFGWIMPSMTPTSGMPAFRVYNVDPVTFAVLDSTTYIADMTNPAFQTTGPVWTKYYSAAEAYGPITTPPLAAGAEMGAAFWHNVTVALEGSQALFNDYYARKTRGWDVGSCTGACVTAEICQMRAGRSENNCGVPVPGLHIKKRDQTTVTSVRDECGVLVSREVLGLMATRKDILAHLVRRTDELQAKQ